MKESLKNTFSIKNNLDDDLFYNSLFNELYEQIDEETQKSAEEVDVEKIEEFSQALAQIKAQKGEEIKIPQKTPDVCEVIKKYQHKRRKKNMLYASCVAVLLFVIIGTVNFTFSNEASQNNRFFKSQTLLTTGKASNLADEFISQKEPSIKKPGKPTVTKPKTSSPVDEISIKNIIVSSPSEILNWLNNKDTTEVCDVFVLVEYNNGEEKEIPLSECDVSEIIKECESEDALENTDVTDVLEETESREIIIRIAYCGFETFITIGSCDNSEEVPSVISIYGNFENGNTADGVRVIGICSDGTEKEIPKEECEITENEVVTEESTNIVVTVKYGDLSFDFTANNEEE
ncbi:MAG: hypothetical protein E7557_09790 [Ruminococcaceae bacterium]|nr:hypothetical protein [Oscillospiraceae bacterium]